MEDTPEFDYHWVKVNRPDLHKAIRAKEDELDALEAAPLSKVLEIMSEWRTLVLHADFEQQSHRRRVEQG
jgi:hypothetical protein